MAPGRSDRLAAVVDGQQGRCLWCGRSFGTLVRPTVDHLVPRLKGGPTTPANLVAACTTCNARRGHLAPLAWRDRCAAEGPGTPGSVPSDGVLRALFDRLEASLGDGGHRRVREYLDGQRRRLARSAGQE